jgi:hypothetical protein
MHNIFTDRSSTTVRRRILLDLSQLFLCVGNQ